jgi:hypothetical protein
VWLLNNLILRIAALVIAGLPALRCKLQEKKRKERKKKKKKSHFLACGRALPKF